MKRGDYVVRSIRAPAHKLTTYQVVDRHGDLVHVTFRSGVVDPAVFDVSIRSVVANHEHRRRRR